MAYQQLSMHNLQQTTQQPVQSASAHGNACGETTRVPRVQPRVALAGRAAQTRRLPTRASTGQTRLVMQVSFID